MATPLTDQDRRRILELHAQGMSRNDIARETGRSPGSVSNVVRDAGLTFERGEEVAAATAARTADNKARRSLILGTLYTRAEEFLEQMTQPHVVFNFGGKDNTYEERTLDRPTTGDIRNLMQSTSIALQRAADLESVDGNGRDLPAVDAWLDAMTSGNAGMIGSEDGPQVR